MSPVYSKPYRVDKLISQHALRDHWLHGPYEHILSKHSILSTTGDSICSLCRSTSVLISTIETSVVITKTSSISETALL